MCGRGAFQWRKMATFSPTLHRVGIQNLKLAQSDSRLELFGFEPNKSTKSGKLSLSPAPFRLADRKTNTNLTCYLLTSRCRVHDSSSSSVFVPSYPHDDEPQPATADPLTGDRRNGCRSNALAINSVIKQIMSSASQYCLAVYLLHCGRDGPLGR